LYSASCRWAKYELLANGPDSIYGITLAYFRVHQKADIEHAAVERELLKSYLDESNFGSVMKSVDEALHAFIICSMESASVTA
jgi:pyrroloquinoline quinone (PQQ) biosynthesis protein C